MKKYSHSKKRPDLKSGICLALVLALLLSLLPFALVADDVAYLSRGEAATRIGRAAADYNPQLDDSLLRGYADGSMRADQPISRVEALALLSRAFGDLGEPNTHYARLAQAGIPFIDVPAWAEGAIANLNVAGILTADADLSLYPGAPVSAQELDTWLQRIWATRGTNLKDDFYAAVNREALAASSIAPGDPARNTFYDVGYLNAARINLILAEILAGGNLPGSREDKIAVLYDNIMDYEKRNADGVKPIQAWLDAVGAATDIEALMAVRRDVLEATGVIMLMGFAPQIDLKDSSRYQMSLTGSTIMLPKEYYTAGYEPVQEFYIGYLSSMYQLCGMDAGAADVEAQRFFEMEQALAAEMMDIQDYSNVDKIYNVFTMAQAQEIFPTLDLAGLLLGDGYQATDTVVINDPALLKAYAAYFSGDGLATLKADFCLSLAVAFGPMLNAEFETVNDGFMQALTGVQGEKEPAERASLTLQSVMSPLLEDLYIERYFSEAAKADVEAMVRSFFSVYKDTLAGLAWMSDVTKEEAQRKLEAMNLKIGYPDKRDDSLDDVEFRRAGEGGSFFDNICAIARKNHKLNTQKQNQPVDKSAWALSAYTVNAYYNATANEIVFPAGILQAPFYDINASLEENLGGIGFVIAHEITHSFDNNGSKFDEYGNAANWWTPEDYATFDGLCEAAVALFDGVESAPGVAMNGRLTLSENIADLGALACITEVARRSGDNPDYRAMFVNLAKCWVDTTYRDYAILLSQIDVHAANKIRVNRVVQNSEVFHRVFDIQPGDGMYLAPEKRVNIW